MADQYGDFVNLISRGGGNILGGGGRLATRTLANRIPIDIINEEKTIFIYAEIPGVTKENINVDFYNNKMTINAEKVRTYHNGEIAEIKFGKFERAITLPICVTKRETVAVSYENGILKIKITKLFEEENKFSLGVNV